MTTCSSIIGTRKYPLSHRMLFSNSSASPMIRRLKASWILFGAALLFLLFPTVGFSTPLGPITHILVEAHGIGPQSDGCAAFVVDAEQVRTFFDKAVLISGRQQHDFFLYGPCSARGTMENRYGKWHWEIRNLGTATVTATNGDTFLFGDPDRESSLADE